MIQPANSFYLGGKFSGSQPNGVEHRVGEIYDLHAPVLYGLIHKILPDKQQAEVTFGQLFLYLRLHLQEHNPQRSSFLNWLLNTARSLAINNLYCQTVKTHLPDAATSRSVTALTVQTLHEEQHHSASVISERLSLPVWLVLSFLPASAHES